MFTPIPNGNCCTVDKRQGTMHQLITGDCAMSWRGRERGPDRGQRKNSTLPPELWESLKQQPGENTVEWKRRRARETMRYWRSIEANKKKERDIRNLNYSLFGESAAKKKWLEANPDKPKQYARKYFEKNREKKIMLLKQWVAENQEKFQQAKKVWLADNKGLMAHHASKRRAAELQATPYWVNWDEIAEIYITAGLMSKHSDVEYHVDHIVPLQGDNVCGLHVPWNLRIIPATDNLHKSNKLDENLALGIEQKPLSLEDIGL